MRIRNAALLAAAVAAGALAPSGGAVRAAAGYDDPPGDSRSVADVTSISVSNDAAGSLLFRISIANRPSLAPEDVLLIAIDADRKPSTGGQQGTEFVLVHKAADGSTRLLKWNGATYADYAHGSLLASYADGVARFGFAKEDIGGVASFDFFVATASSGGSSDEDDAPDNGVFTYTLSPPVKIDSAHALFAPGAPRAGRLFRVSSVRLFLTDASKVSIAPRACTARLAGRLLKPAVKCAWRIPARSKGKLLSVFVAVSYRGDGGTLAPYTMKVR